MAAKPKTPKQKAKAVYPAKKMADKKKAMACGGMVRKGKK